MKKLKKVFGVFAVALLLMSMSSVDNQSMLKNTPNICWEIASSYGNYVYENEGLFWSETEIIIETTYQECMEWDDLEDLLD